ncbi:uncharacterized protein LOC133520957 [Cydia pomonella]|uniref:uncharacterized protein LOC133520957 n=1 Tax=Cydia pomonella TaxID=82600 RepID=UPI002ADD6C8D|nr:uncharacterized protein LOC133520957 [Cydia pomonella]
MYARTQRSRLQAISLAILLAIIDRTQGFTLRYEYVRPHDLTAEESRVSEDRHELKRDIVENAEFQVAPIGVALPLTMTTESIAETALNNEIVTVNNVKPETNQIETTTNTNEQGESKEDNTSTTADNEVKRNFISMMVSSELERKDTTPLPQVETTTVITETFTTEASANKENNESKNIDDMSSTVNTTTPDVTVSEPPNTAATTTESNIIETTATWKKYTKIERKHVSVKENVVPLRTERIGDSINAHTTETRVSLEKAFNLAPDILSLQELKTHLLDATNSVPTEVNPTEIVSKRAGYLDHTKPELDPVISTTVNASKAGYEVEMDGVVYEMDTHEENDYTLNKTSHSQMAEDALKEVLLEEARLDDKKLFTTTPKSDRSYVELNEITPSPQSKQDDQQQTDDPLTVRPINNDKKSILYTVSPNYKPLKKIEVQPSKPFVRDPDDNSWRNESLSSLGIVFKGKNSTKAFTEVIKNKTEIVMNNNTTEPEKVLTKVDLRDRLEKIAEKRKRKKKIDKYGNTEYGDYEENTSSDTHSKEKSEISLTTLPTPPELVNPGILFGTKIEELPEKYASKKPKFTLDYYDGKDDDADYATYPNIDILKSTPRPRVQWPVTQRILDNTHHVRTYLPDRQPTVQYFPPRSKTQNDNNFPTFGHTAQPQNEPFETYTKNTPSKYVTSDKIQHVEYRPVGANDGFMIRHYKDLLESVAKDIDYDKNSPYQTPMSDEGKSVKSEEYDYGQRKEGINKYVDYFNQNHERFKADFPVVFNTSIVHGAERGKVLASSSAMFKRLYNGVQAKEAFAFSNKPFDPNCENVTVELSPAYELHYYVPDQEETGTDHTLPYGYRN